MTAQEFSDSFDILINSFSRDIDIGKDNSDIAFNEYEKSIFLTKAQEQLVISLYSGKNSTGDTFESSEEIRRSLASLVVQNTLYPNSNNGISSNSYIITLDNDVLFIVYESATLDKLSLGCLPNTNILVLPVTHDEYHKVKNNPFRGTNSHRVLRLDVNVNKDSNSYIELVSKYPVESYTYRYIRKLKPIILLNLEDGLTINNESTVMTSELSEVLHNKILELAVALALQSRGINKQQ